MEVRDITILAFSDNYKFVKKVLRMLIETILVAFGITVYGYNVDTNFPIIYSYNDIVKDRQTSSNNSYFGYTVQLYHDKDQNSSWLIVGAPRGTSSRIYKQMSRNPIEPGVVYRCTINKICQEVEPIIENEEYRVQLGFRIRIMTHNGWFGSAIAIDRPNRILTVCAPRTMIRIFNAESPISLHGMCYSGRILSNFLSAEAEDLIRYDFRSHFWYNPIHGFSIHYATSRGNEEGRAGRVIGEPHHETYGSVNIVHSNKQLSVELPLNNELAYFGYSVESGYFFNKTQLLYVGGAPNWEYVGQVAIINPSVKPPLSATLRGTDIGEYFGASLAVGDLNNDGLDDLLIGAPHWGQDIGRVYIYFGTLKGRFEEPVLLQGSTEGGNFGYAIACGDLDADGFDDIIVSAPWEENGTIYVYNGGTDLKDTNLQPSEQIEAVNLIEHSSSAVGIRSFGFTISKPIDIDGNGYSDIAVGAYKSGHVVLFRSKPVVKTQLEVQAIPNILQRDAKQFVIKICVQYDEHNTKTEQKFKITLTIDKEYQRTKETLLELKSSNSTSNRCLTTQVNISKNIQEFIEPISIVARHSFVYNTESKYFCNLCPVEKRNNKLKTAQILVPFNIGCGEDKICNCNISAVATFHGVRDNNTWVIGSSDISLEISLKNRGEPAYLTSLEFLLPEGVALHSILPSCQEDTSEKNLIVICDAGNPIGDAEEKSIKLDLDMKHLIHGSLHDRKLNFYVTIKTHSENHGMVNVTKALNLVNEVSLSLNGEADEKAYYLSTVNDDVSNISFQHTYQIYKLGATPIENAQIVIKVPTVIKNSEPLVHVYKPQLYISGEVYECSSADFLLDTESAEVQEPSLDQFNTYMLSNETKQNNEHEIHKRDLNGSTNQFYDMESVHISEATNDNVTTDSIYMNCSSIDVHCITITCNLNALKTLQDVGKIIIKLLLNTKSLKDTFTDDGIALKFSTEANVEIMKPAIRLSVRKIRSTMEIVTTFYNTPKTEELKSWIIVVSISLGLLLLLALVAILSKLGFFKRKNKQNMPLLKNNDINVS